MHDQDRLKTFSLAEKELGAFVAAVGQTRGTEAGRRAAEYWVEALEQLDAAAQPPFDWRRITITAASRLARETISTAGRSHSSVGQLNC